MCLVCKDYTVPVLMLKNFLCAMCSAFFVTEHAILKQPL